MKYEVIDNFLDEEYFDSLVTLIADKEKTGNSGFPWFFNPSVEYAKTHKNWKPDESNPNKHYMYHIFYDWNVPRSDFFERLLPLISKLEVRCLLRVKANLYPHTEKLLEYQMHEDDNFSHSGCVLSLNTCDGYTKLKDGTKIDSVANRMLLFDPREEHAPTSTTNVPARFNINLNYIQVETTETQALMDWNERIL